MLKCQKFYRKADPLYEQTEKTDSEATKGKREAKSKSSKKSAAAKQSFQMGGKKEEEMPIAGGVQGWKVSWHK